MPRACATSRHANPTCSTVNGCSHCTALDGSAKRIARMPPSARSSMLMSHRRDISRRQKALTQMNVQLTNVITDITGEIGLKIIRAIVAAERSRTVLAAMKNYRVHASVETIAKALEGRWSREPLFSLTHELKAYDFVAGEQIARLDVEIDMLLGSMKAFDTVPEVHANKGRRKNTPAFDGRRALLNVGGVDLTEVPGIDVGTALKIVSEVGRNLSRFETAKRFCSWLGLCPGTRISGNQRLSGASKRIANRVSRALKLAALGLSRSKCAMEPTTAGFACAWVRPRRLRPWRTSSLASSMGC